MVFLGCALNSRHAHKVERVGERVEGRGQSVVYLGCALNSRHAHKVERVG